MFLFKRFQWLFFILFTAVLYSCMTTAAKKNMWSSQDDIDAHHSEILIFAESWKGHKSSDLMIHYPDAEVTEIGEGMYRYKIDFEAPFTFQEYLTEGEREPDGTIHGAAAYIHVYFVAKGGVIESYHTKRTVDQKRIKSIFF